MIIQVWGAPRDLTSTIVVDAPVRPPTIVRPYEASRPPLDTGLMTKVTVSDKSIYQGLSPASCDWTVASGAPFGQVTRTVILVLFM